MLNTTTFVVLIFSANELISFQFMEVEILSLNIQASTSLMRMKDPLIEILQRHSAIYPLLFTIFNVLQNI